ncbi:MAG TPA: prepilin-type N-terminal cleavage/methylation domain-containing protein [Candidatus Hydrogenedentes bacterium]|nr:prepilin-type N-terminal cleavage/methylation domain-containing protein [Candidatus Hydrogenedentota bacterium]HPG67197.1 prepilin-type N-terminal cleavage/methylation domain-containing protein [Candidatus Hydrogenedentota bacterium]
MNHQRRHRGFTLLELLVVIVLMGVATTLGGTILLRVMDNFRHVSARVELDAMVDRAFEQMRKDFADALSAELSGVSFVSMSEDLTEEVSEEVSEEADTASPEGLSLRNDMMILPIRTSTGPDQPPIGAKIRYRIERENARSVLVQTIGDLATDIPIGGRIEVIPRANVLAMRVEYAGRDGKWVNAADDEGWFDKLPRAVRVSLVVAHQDRPFEQVARAKVFPIHVD